jgi:hypothetical protein
MIKLMCVTEINYWYLFLPCIFHLNQRIGKAKSLGSDSLDLGFALLVVCTWLSQLTPLNCFLFCKMGS